MLRMPGLIRKRTEVIRELFRTADKIVALNQWTKELLRVNGVEESKIEVIRHGIPETGCRIPDSGSEEDSKFKLRNSEGALRLVFLGRVAPEKGIDVLLRAMEMVKIPVELDVYGIGSDMGNGISDIGNAKVRWLEPVKPEKVVETIGKYDALVVPSVWLETGPLVVLEAFAAGVPVIGSRLGGIVEMVQDGVNGVLFQPGDPAALAFALEKFFKQRGALEGNIKKPKIVKHVAEEHAVLYRNLV